MSVAFQLPPPGRLTPNNERDPLPYYYKPLTGWLYRHRLQMGLDLLPAGTAAACWRWAWAAAILVPTLTARYPRTWGPIWCWPRAGDAGGARLRGPLPAAPTCWRRPATARCRPTTSTPSSASRCWSTSPTPTAPRVAWRGRSRPGGTLVTGYPMVSPLMTRAFAAIGYPNIDEDHVSPPVRIAAALRRVLRPIGRAAFPPARADAAGAVPVHVVDEVAAA